MVISVLTLLLPALLALALLRATVILALAPTPPEAAMSVVRERARRRATDPESRP